MMNQLTKLRLTCSIVVFSASATFAQTDLAYSKTIDSETFGGKKAKSYEVKNAQIVNRFFDQISVESEGMRAVSKTETGIFRQKRHFKN